MSAFDPDEPAAASHRNIVAHLSGPLAAGAVDHPIAIGADARALLAWRPREPLLVAALRRDLGDETLTLTVTVSPDGVGARSLASLTWDRWSERGSFLLLAPASDPLFQSPLPVTLGLALTAAGVALAPNAVAGAVELRLVEGVLGRTVFLLGAEKQRIRRAARELTAMRSLATARDEALDRTGEELGVPRFAESMAWDGSEIVTTRAREDDASYRRRLGIYRPFLVPNRRRALGLLRDAGLAAIDLVEADNPFAVAVRLVSVAPSLAAAKAQKRDFFAHLRRTRLLEPAAAVPAARFLPKARRAREDALRQRLAGDLKFDAQTHIAPALALALDRLARCVRALGVHDALRVRRGQDAAGGSRYELGIGVDWADFADATKQALYLAASGRVNVADAEVGALLAEMKPTPVATDPDCRWLMHPCGLATVHRIDQDWLYVSAMPALGLTISGVADTPGPHPVDLDAHLAGPLDSGLNVVLARALTQARAATAGAWSELGDHATQVAAWQSAVNPSPGVAQSFRDLALPVVTQPQFGVALAKLPPQLVTTLVVSGLSQTQRGELVAALRDAGMVAAVPLGYASGDVHLVVSVIGLPQIGSNLGARRATGFRWYAVPITGPGGSIGALGSRTRFLPAGHGLTAIVCIAYARIGLTDPYEVRAEAPAGVQLDLAQYEYLMNVLDHLHPLGVEVNTWSIRQAHVDLDGDGVAEPLGPSRARTFRPFRRPRHVGAAAVTLEPGSEQE
ncbi:MAG: hypothetical protein U1F43_34115 [Myxococcota bacterium]